MKTKSIVLLIIILGGLSLSSCDPESVSYDPQGTIFISIRNEGGSSIPIGIQTYIIINDNNKPIEHISSAFVKISQDNNFVCYGCEMTSLGKVSGLGAVARIPKTGWAGEVAVVEGHGYMVRIRNERIGEDPNQYTYGRIYVVSTTEGTNGGIIGYKVKYQTPFVP